MWNSKMISTLITMALLLVAPVSAYPEVTEQWSLILDDGQGWLSLTLVKEQDGNLTSYGDWEYTYQGSIVFGSFDKAEVTISGKSFESKSTGIAINPSAPPGYTTSFYTSVLSGTAYDGFGNGTFTMTFQTYGWPKLVTGFWQGTRTSGSGITEDPPAPPPPPEKIITLPWLMLLLEY